MKRGARLAVIAVLLSSCTLKGNPVPEPSARQSPYIRAKAALLVLRTVGGRPNVNRYVILPDSDVISESRALEVLAARPKPIACSSTTSAKTLMVECDHLER